jgi:hypothetical protein
MNGSGRLRRLEQASAWPAPPTEQQALKALRTGTWTWLDFRVALGEAQLARLEGQLLSDAVAARQRREAGEEPSLGVPHCIAAEIVSHPPDEDVPAEYQALLERHLRGGRLVDGSLSATYFIGAGAAILLLKTPDGIQLRRRLWKQRTDP